MTNRLQESTGMNCLTCFAPLPAAAKFCPNCGHGIGAPAAEPASSPRRQYIPPEVAAKLGTKGSGSSAARGESANGEIAGERRVVTVLFCDVKGSTALAERLDPEEWTEIMNAVFERLIDPVTRYGGTVARLMGDAILAFFGAPVAHEDDPRRAVLAGLAIVDGIQDYRDQLRREQGLTFDVRVGINTGLVVVGEVGSSQRVEYTAMGDAVNLAARMEQTAQPGTVQISGQTYQRVAPLFRCEPLGPIEVKGKTETVLAYRVFGPRSEPGRERGIAGRAAPLVGRDAELAALREVIAEQRQGRGRVVCLVGEAGLGKSRLVEEMWASWSSHDGGPVGAGSASARHWSASRGISYETLRPYGQFRQHLESVLELKENDPPAAARGKIARALAGTAPERQPRLAHALELLLGIDRSGDGPALEGESLRRELFEAFLVILREWAASSPSVLVFDDVHWADSASVELLCHLFRLVDEVPLIFLCAFRPDRQAASRGVKACAEALRAGYVEIALRPLASEESAALVEGLLGADAVPATLRELAIQKADGNPFFVEELVRELLERGILARDSGAGSLHLIGGVGDIAVPGSVQGLLLARIDRLPEDARQVLQVAAVIGRSFSYQLLQSVVGEPTRLDQRLASLIDLDLILDRATTSDRELVFRHALTRDAAYDSLLRKRRRELHRRVGEVLEQTHAGQLEDHATLLAHHFSEAGDGRAGPYESLAGDVAYRLYANTEAIAHYSRAIEHLRRGSDAPGDRLLHLYLRRGRAMELGNRYPDALVNYRELEAVADARGDRGLKLAALLARAIVRATPNSDFDPVEGQALLDQSLALARALGDREAECRVLWNLLLLNTYTFEPSRAVAYGEQALALARQLGLRELIAFTANDLQRAYLFEGRADRARQVLDESQALWRELNNAPMLADNLASQIHLDYLAGDFPRAIAAFEEADRLTASIGNAWGRAFCRMIVGQIYLDRGELDRGMEIMEDAIRFGAESGQPVVLIGTRSHLAWAYGRRGEVDRGRELARQAIARAEATFPILRPWPLGALARLQVLAGDLDEAEATVKEGYQEMRRGGSLLTPVWVMLAAGELALARGEPDRALVAMDELLAYLRDFQTRPYTAEALALRGQAYLAKGQVALASQHLLAARAEAEALGATATLESILALLAHHSFQPRQSQRRESGRIVLP